MTPLETFAALVVGGRSSLPLLAIAAQVPAYADPGCEPQRVVDHVDAWRAQLGARIAADASGANRLRLLNHFFFAELGFCGATADYDNVENSFLHRVIERRRGIPITLSLLYIELGKAIGLRLQGVSFPMHFLTRLRLRDGAVYVDVFGGGRTLSVAELQARLRDALPGAPEAALAPYLRAASDREILARLLRNLKALHWKADQWPQALEVINRLLLVLPEAAQERRDRASIYERLECPRAAAADLVAYLSSCASLPDAAETRERLARLQQAAGRLN